MLFFDLLAVMECYANGVFDEFPWLWRSLCSRTRRSSPLFGFAITACVCVCARVFVCVDVYRLRRAVADSAENFEKLKTGCIRRKKLKQKLGCMINCKLYSRLNSFIIFLILKYERIGKYLYDFYYRVYTTDLTYYTDFLFHILHANIMVKIEKKILF